MSDIYELITTISSSEIKMKLKIVNQMLGELPNSLFKNPNKKWLVPASSYGLFVREITVKLMFGLSAKIPDPKERLDHILGNMVYGITTSKEAFLTTKKVLYGSIEANEFFGDIFDDENGNIFYNEEYPFDKFGIKLIGDKSLNFNVVITNPPYQIPTSKKQSKPLYHKFVEMAIKLNPDYISMIVPSRWLTGGMGLSDFRKDMLNCKNIKKIVDFKNSKECFPDVQIEGGVNYFLWDKKYNSNLCDYNGVDRVLNEFNVFIRDNNTLNIIDSIDYKNSIESVVYSINPFDIPTNFTNYVNDSDQNNTVKLYGNKNNMKKYSDAVDGVGYISKNQISKNTNLIDTHKVLLSEAYGGKSQVINIPFYAEPNSITSFTNLIVGVFDSKKECDNMIQYMKTKFFRFLVGIMKETQHTNKRLFKFVPLLDMSINWTDERLYKLYNLSDDDILYIESSISPMV